MLSNNVPNNNVLVLSFTNWLDTFDHYKLVTAADLDRCRRDVGTSRYPEMVLRLARQGKLRPKVLADAAYTAWLEVENPKKALCSSEWAELFRLSYLEGHELFEVLGA